MTAFETLLGALADHDVEFILIGGLAAVAHGSARVTYDVDVVYRRTKANYLRLEEALKPYKPYLRGAPQGLPFTWDVETIRRGLNFTLVTTAGPIDLLGEAAGGGGYEALLPGSRQFTLEGRKIRVTSLKKLIAMKRAAGRPKDFEAVAELESLAEGPEE